LCTRLEHNARNTGWTHVATTAERALGVIYCRAGGGGAGHLTIPDAPASDTPLSADTTTNCFYGSSRPSCPSGFGCNEQSSRALCCAPAPLCGNGRVDSPEEECDDANSNETDDCLNSCTWRVPTSRGMTGTNC
jgi:cysteine-rich repeat protein